MIDEQNIQNIFNSLKGYYNGSLPDDEIMQIAKIEFTKLKSDKENEIRILNIMRAARKLGEWVPKQKIETQEEWEQRERIKKDLIRENIQKEKEQINKDLLECSRIRMDYEVIPDEKLKNVWHCKIETTIADKPGWVEDDISDELFFSELTGVERKIDSNIFNSRPFKAG
jgi:hypothetical protein